MPPWRRPRSISVQADFRPVRTQPLDEQAFQRRLRRAQRHGPRRGAVEEARIVHDVETLAVQHAPALLVDEDLARLRDDAGAVLDERLPSASRAWARRRRSPKISRCDDTRCRAGNGCRPEARRSACGSLPRSRRSRAVSRRPRSPAGSGAPSTRYEYRRNGSPRRPAWAPPPGPSDGPVSEPAGSLVASSRTTLSSVDAGAASSPPPPNAPPKALPRPPPAPWPAPPAAGIDGVGLPVRSKGIPPYDCRRPSGRRGTASPA